MVDFGFNFFKLSFLGLRSFFSDEILMFFLLIAVNFYILKLYDDFLAYLLFLSLWLPLLALALSLPFHKDLRALLCRPGCHSVDGLLIPTAVLSTLGKHHPHSLSDLSSDSDFLGFHL